MMRTQDALCPVNTRTMLDRMLMLGRIQRTSLRPSVAIETRRVAVVALIVILVSAGCRHDPTSPIVHICAGPQPAFRVKITDSRTGIFAASGSVVIATSGSYADTARVPVGAADSTSVFLAYRPGTYSVRISKPGYADWTQGGLLVGSNLPPCEGEPAGLQQLTAQLVPTA